jgi:hydrogenase maturation factor
VLPGIDPASAHCDDSSHCITCGDVALPLRVVAIDPVRELALCEDAASGARETVEIALVLPVAPGDELLVHAGTAIAHNVEVSP